MVNTVNVINGMAYLLGAVGAIMQWRDSRKSGSSVGAYANAELLNKIKSISKESIRIKDYAMLLIGVSFIMQFIALFL